MKNTDASCDEPNHLPAAIAHEVPYDNTPSIGITVRHRLDDPLVAPELVRNADIGQHCRDGRWRRAGKACVGTQTGYEQPGLEHLLGTPGCGMSAAASAFVHAAQLDHDAFVHAVWQPTAVPYPAISFC